MFKGIFQDVFLSHLPVFFQLLKQLGQGFLILSLFLSFSLVLVVMVVGWFLFVYFLFCLCVCVCSEVEPRALHLLAKYFVIQLHLGPAIF